MRIRLCLVASAAGVGGGEKNLFDIAAHFSGLERYKVFVICPSGGFLVDKLERLNVEVAVVPMPSVPKINSFLKIAMLFKKWKIDIIHAHGTRAALYGRVASKIKTKKPCIYTLHGLHYVHYENKVLKWACIFCERILAKWTNAFICVCHANVKEALRYKVIKEEKTVVIYNGLEDLKPLNLTAITRIRKDFGIDGDKQFALHVSRFEPVKGQMCLIKAISKVVQNNKKAKFVLVGDGEIFDQIIREAKALGLTEDEVCFVGRREDITELMLACDIFVLSSLREGLPYVILEAMAASKPVVSTNVDGVPEAVEDMKAGLLVNPCDSNSLAESLMILINDCDKAKMLGKEARKKYLEMFTMSKMLKDIQGLYEGAIID